MTSEIKVDTISEQTSANGVTIDGLTIKDGNIIGDVALAGTTPTFTVGDGGAEDASLIFDGNAVDYYIALDDSADNLIIGSGSTVGSNSLITIDSDGDFTLDSAGDIILDADGAQVIFKDAGTTIGGFNNSSSDLNVFSHVQDKDIVFTGDDGGLTITALTLDMSNAGRANFNNDIGLNDDRGVRFGSDDDSVIYNDGSNFYIKNGTLNHDIIFQGNDDGSAITALTLDMSAAGAATFNDKITAVGTSVFTNLDISGDIDVDGTTNLDVVDIDGAVDMASTLTMGGNIDLNGNDLIIDADADSYIHEESDDVIGIYANGKKTAEIDRFGQYHHYRDGGTTFGGAVNFIHQRGSIASPTIVNSGDTIGVIKSTVYDGTAYLDGSRILFSVDGTPGDDDMPTRISFQVTADGTAGTLSEAMRISEDNKVGINIANSGTAMLKIFIPDSQYGLETLPAVNQTYYAAIFRNSSGNDVGRIEASASATSFVTSSDYRLKENVVTDWDATTRLKQLKPSRFNFINTPDTTVDGFLAHEVSSIVPEAISGDKDEIKAKEKVVINADGVVIAEDVKQINWTTGKEDGTFPTDSTWEASKTVPVYQAIDQSKLVPLMVKTIQELEARITTLEG